MSSVWNKLSVLYLDARELLIERGWAQDWGYADGSTCVMGAIHIAGGMATPDQRLKLDIEVPARKLLLEVINNRRDEESWFTDPEDWNDVHGRTKRSVLAKLEQAAKLARERELEEIAAQKVVLPRSARTQDPERKLDRKATVTSTKQEVHV